MLLNNKSNKIKIIKIQDCWITILSEQVWFLFHTQILFAGNFSAASKGSVSRFSLLKWLLCLAEWIWRYSMYILFLLVRDKAQKPVLFCKKLYFQPFWSWVRISPKVSNFLSLAEKYHLPFSQQLTLPAEKYNSPFFFRSIWILSLSGIYQKILSPVLCKKGISSTMNTLQYDQTLPFSAEWQDSIIFFCHFWVPCICLI